MDLVQQHSFYVTISSDEGVARFPKNRDSDFSVQLGPETVITPSDWEVGLATFTYRYDFNTVGYDNLIALRIGDRFHEVKLPVWNCQTIEQLAGFLDVEINKIVFQGQRGGNVGANPVKVTVDAFKRVKFLFGTSDYDIGFADNTAKLLGFSEQMHVSMENFRSRLMMRDLVRGSQKKGALFEVWKLEELQDKIDQHPDMLYTMQFLPEFLRTLPVENLSYLNVIDSKQLLFRRLAGGAAQTPFKKSLDAEAEALALPGGKRPGFEFVVITEVEEKNLKNGVVNELKDLHVLNMFEAGMFVRTNHLDWLQTSAYKDLISFDELDTFIKKFEQQIHEDERTTFKAEEGVVTYSPIYTEAVASFIFSKYLQAFKKVSTTLYGSEPASLIPIEQMYIYLDIIKPEPVNNLMSPLLEIIRTEGSSGMLTQFRAGGHIQYKAIEKSNLTNIRVLIASKDGGRIPFLRGPTELQLHFRKKNRRFSN